MALFVMLNLRRPNGVGPAKCRLASLYTSDFEYDFEQDKRTFHGVTFKEAVDCFFSDFEVRRNKKFKDRYQLIGETIGGRRLKIIFQLRAKRVVRIITGWSV